MIKAFILLLALVTLGGADVAEAGLPGRLVPGQWQQSWNDALKENLFKSPLMKHTDSGVEKLCTGYGADQEKRKIFWQQLFVSLAWKEAMHGPGNYVHFNGGINIGLYQINPLLRKAYSCQGLDLYNAIDNIKCGVRMATKLVKRFGSVLVGTKEGLAAYWQPLRATSAYNRGNRAFILGTVTKACSLKKIAYISTSKHLTAMSDLTTEVDQTVNTIDDLGLSPEELDYSPYQSPLATPFNILENLTFQPAPIDSRREYQDI